jgi:hypothetical protein
MAFDTRTLPFKIRLNEPLAYEPTSNFMPDNITKLETYSKDTNTLYALVLKQSGASEFYLNGIKLF